ncbi:unnamed protein product [Mytilus edulis]|uniref:Uncharacterized protein n=1 Tax=Mytilus edulis TaxID=6550 RepID=A0A8S3QAC9_MYTED|nr:unnamed protein product [Mytilus edulis]
MVTIFFYTNKDNHPVICYDIHGNLKWEFNDAQNLRYPQGISVDSNGNVYVVSKDTNSVVIITPNGKHCRTILSFCDGLSNPCALHFEPTSNKLLVANKTEGISVDSNGNVYVASMDTSSGVIITLMESVAGQYCPLVMAFEVHVYCISNQPVTSY